MYRSRQSQLRNAAGAEPRLPTDGPYAAAIQFYTQNKWLNPDEAVALHPEQPLTREELAVALIRMVKYDKLAVLLNAHNLDTVLDRDEIAEVKENDVALTLQLGLLTAADGRFAPDRQVTKAEAAVVLLRLAELQGRLDQAIVN